MTKPIKTIGIILKPSEMEDLPNTITNLVRWLSRRQKSIYFLSKEKPRLTKALTSNTIEKFEYIQEKFLFNEVDLILSLGGDGTLLGVSRLVNPKVPVFAVNLGRLGFITEFSKNDFYEKLNVVLTGRFESFKKNLYSVSVHEKNKKSIKKYFFNDAVFTKNDLARMFSLSLESEDEHVYNLSGDGLIVSSTYGSTAYSLAAGGPIVHPDVKALILTPICAHSLTHRPLVIPDSERLTIKLLDKIDSVNITLDGQESICIGFNNTVTLNKESKRSIQLIKNDERTYFHTLKEKFVHGRRETY